MTAEVTFAKSFLSTLDSRPVKLQSDYAADQRTIELKGAVSLPIAVEESLMATSILYLACPRL